MGAVQLGRERLEAVERERVVVGGPRAAQPGLDGRAVALGQVLEHVAFLVAHATLHRDGAEDLGHGGPECLGAVEDDEHALLAVKAAIDQV